LELAVFPGFVQDQTITPVLLEASPSDFENSFGQDEFCGNFLLLFLRIAVTPSMSHLKENVIVPWVMFEKSLPPTPHTHTKQYSGKPEGHF
jgi:hypothetical protein